MQIRGQTKNLISTLALMLLLLLQLQVTFVFFSQMMKGLKNEKQLKIMMR